MAGHGGSSAGSYLADPTSPIPSHCASVVTTSTVRVNSICCVVLRGCMPSIFHSFNEVVSQNERKCGSFTTNKLLCMFKNQNFVRLNKDESTGMLFIKWFADIKCVLQKHAPVFGLLKLLRKLCEWECLAVDHCMGIVYILMFSCSD